MKIQKKKKKKIGGGGGGQGGCEQRIDIFVKIQNFYGGRVRGFESRGGPVGGGGGDYSRGEGS